jgi:acetyl esterase
VTDQGYTTVPVGTPVDQLAGGPGLSHIDTNDPAAPNYELLARLRTPLTLREIMIQPVRTGYIGQDHPIDPELMPPSGTDLFPNVAVEQIYLPSPDGPIRCQVYRRQGDPGGQPLILYAHGGGFMVGRSEDTDFVTRALCAQNGAIVVSVNYRLAPEWPFPTGLDDFLTAYGWLRTQGQALGGDPARVAIAGDSSGANFAAAAPLRARERGLPPPRAVVLLGPVCDFRFEAYESFNRQAPTGIIYDAAFAGFLRGAYVRADQWDHPHVSPIRGDLAGYPPAIVVVGTHDPMIDSASLFAQQLGEAGNPYVELFVRDGMPHGFYFFPNLFQQEEAAYAAIQHFLARHLIGGS